MYILHIVQSTLGAFFGIDVLYYVLICDVMCM